MLRACLLAGLVSLVSATSLAQPPATSDVSQPPVRALAEAGDTDAAFAYGYELIFPEDGESDPVTGLYWLARAADAGHAPANAVLGLVYRDGIGVEADPDRARAFLELAWSAGDPFAGHDLAELILYDFASERSTAITLLEALLDDADIGPTAALTLAETLLFEGDGDADARRATDLAHQALARDPDLTSAHYVIGVAAADGLGAPVDQDAARAAWTLGAEAGDSLALLALADSWMDEAWGTPDPVEAYVLYSLAADLGEPDADDEMEALADTLDAAADAQIADRRASWEGRLGWGPPLE